MPSIWDDIPWEEKTIQQATKDNETEATLIFRRVIKFKWGDKEIECLNGKFDIDLTDPFVKTILDCDDETLVVEACQTALSLIQSNLIEVDGPGFAKNPRSEVSARDYILYSTFNPTYNRKKK